MKLLQKIKEILIPVRRDGKGLATGSTKKAAKEINIQFTQKHLYFAIGLLFVFFVLFYFDILNPIEKTQYVKCADGTQELYLEDKEIYCGENLTQWLIDNQGVDLNMLNMSFGG